MNILTLKFINFKRQHIFTVILKNGNRINIFGKRSTSIFPEMTTDSSHRSFFKKQSASIFPEMMTDPSHPSFLEKFSHIDYRNCQCDNIISHLFWKLHQHIEKSGKLIIF